MPLLILIAVLLLIAGKTSRQVKRLTRAIATRPPVHVRIADNVIQPRTGDVPSILIDTPVAASRTRYGAHARAPRTTAPGEDC